MLRPRFTYANVMSSIAAFLALGGTSYAVVNLPRNSVGARELKPGAVTTEKLAAGVAISGPRGPRGVAGPSGAPGPQGPIGATGARGPATVITKPLGSAALPPGTGNIAVQQLTLPAGNWWLLATGSWVGGVAGDWFRCSIPAGNTRAGAVGRVGPDAGGAMAIPYSVQGYVQLAAVTTVELQCGHDGGPLGGNPRIDHAQFTAIRTDDLQTP